MFKSFVFMCIFAAGEPRPIACGFGESDETYKTEAECMVRLANDMNKIKANTPRVYGQNTRVGFANAECLVVGDTF